MYGSYKVRLSCVHDSRQRSSHPSHPPMTTMTMMKPTTIGGCSAVIVAGEAEISGNHRCRIVPPPFSEEAEAAVETELLELEMSFGEKCRAYWATVVGRREFGDDRQQQQDATGRSRRESTGLPDVLRLVVPTKREQQQQRRRRGSNKTTVNTTRKKEDVKANAIDESLLSSSSEKKKMMMKGIVSDQSKQIKTEKKEAKEAAADTTDSEGPRKRRANKLDLEEDKQQDEDDDDDDGDTGGEEEDEHGERKEEGEVVDFVSESGAWTNGSWLGDSMESKTLSKDDGKNGLKLFRNRIAKTDTGIRKKHKKR